MYDNKSYIFLCIYHKYLFTIYIFMRKCVKDKTYIGLTDFNIIRILIHLTEIL